jgi:hypothetical protein
MIPPQPVSSMTTDATTALAAERPLGELQLVARFDGAMLTGVTVSHQGRVFVNFPKWGDDVKFTVAEVRDGRHSAYPDQATNDTAPDDLAGTLVSSACSTARSPAGASTAWPRTPSRTARSTTKRWRRRC